MPAIDWTLNVGHLLSAIVSVVTLGAFIHAKFVRFELRLDNFEKVYSEMEKTRELYHTLDKHVAIISEQLRGKNNSEGTV